MSINRLTDLNQDVVVLSWGTSRPLEGVSPTRPPPSYDGGPTCAKPLEQQLISSWLRTVTRRLPRRGGPPSWAPQSVLRKTLRPSGILPDSASSVDCRGRSSQASYCAPFRAIPCGLVHPSSTYCRAIRNYSVVFRSPTFQSFFQWCFFIVSPPLLLSPGAPAEEGACLVSDPPVKAQQGVSLSCLVIQC